MKTAFVGFVRSGLPVLILVTVGCVRLVALDAPAFDAGTLATHRDFVLVVETAEGSADAPIEALREQTLLGLTEKGYRESAEGPLVVEVVAGEDRVRLRTATPDPGYNTYALREREEAVVTLRISASGGGTEVWRGAARVRLPDEGLLIGPSRETAWRRAVAEIIQRLPERARP